MGKRGPARQPGALRREPGIMFKASAEIVAKLDRLAAARGGLSRSAMLRRLIEEARDHEPRTDDGSRPERAHPLDAEQQARTREHPELSRRFERYVAAEKAAQRDTLKQMRERFRLYMRDGEHD